MANVRPPPLKGVLLEIAKSTPIDDVPFKLRCAACNKLAIDAVKLPCCDQNICVLCADELPETCPICDHDPVSSKDCIPHRPLRLTVRAFVKAIESKTRKESATTVAANTTPAVPGAAAAATPATTTAPAQAPSATAQAPTSAVQAPPATVQAPTSAVQAPTTTVQAPATTAQAPAAAVQPPTTTVQASAISTPANVAHTEDVTASQSTPPQPQNPVSTDASNNAQVTPSTATGTPNEPQSSSNQITGPSTVTAEAPDAVQETSEVTGDTASTVPDPLNTVQDLMQTPQSTTNPTQSTSAIAQITHSTDQQASADGLGTSSSNADAAARLGANWKILSEPRPKRKRTFDDEDEVLFILDNPDIVRYYPPQRCTSLMWYHEEARPKSKQRNGVAQYSNSSYWRHNGPKHIHGYNNRRNSGFQQQKFATSQNQNSSVVQNQNSSVNQSQNSSASQNQNSSDVAMGNPSMALLQQGMNMIQMMSKFYQAQMTPRSRLSGPQGTPGMNGMNMDPSMMFGGGFGGGFNSMGGMNMGNMGGIMNMNMDMSGMGGFGGMPDMGNMNGGTFFPQNGGYNPQQNFGASPMMNNSNFYHQNNHGFAGRGMYNGRGGGFARGGRGSYGRGRGGIWQQNYGQYYNNQGQGSTIQHLQTSQDFSGHIDTAGLDSSQRATRGSPSYEPVNETNGISAKANSSPTSAKHEAVEVVPSAAIDATNHKAHADTDKSAVEEAQKPALEHENGNKGTSAIESVGGTTASAHYAHDTATNGSPVNALALKPQRGPDSGMRGSGATRGRASNVENVNEPEAIKTAPLNAPTGPKAMRDGLPNSGRYSRQATSAAPPVFASSIEPERPQTTRDMRGRSRSRSFSRSRTDGRQKRQRSSPDRDESRASSPSNEQHHGRESRKRKDRDERTNETHIREVNGDRPVKKMRSESPDDDTKRHRRDKDETRQSSRSRRESSRDRRKDRHRSRSPHKEGKDKARHRSRSPKRDHGNRVRHRSRSPKKYDGGTNGEVYESSRRKDRSESKREDVHEPSDKTKDRDRNHRRSHRDDADERESNERPTHSSSHRRSSDARYRERDYSRSERESDRRRSAIEQLSQDDGEFKIKGRSTAARQASEKINESFKVKQSDKSAMRPPSTFKSEGSERRSSITTLAKNPPMDDIYAADRERARKDRENIQRMRLEGRRVSGQSLGKRDRGEEFIAPTGPSGDADKMHAGKRPKKDMRRHSTKFEGEIGDGADEREVRRFR